jgi:membrane-associated protease RseP (regulator of RpoE activity)
MSEPASPFPATLNWDQQPQPAVWVIPPPRPRWWLHILLLAATFLSTLVVGARIYANFAAHQPAFSFNDDSISLFPVEWMWQAPARLMHGFSFSLTLMFILLAHEMGHYLYARHYHVYATPPFFIPFPSLIGTLGAFIRIKGLIPNRAALFDIGIAGPIAGFIPSCAAVLTGLSLSHPQVFRSAALENEPGFPLAFHLAARILHISVPLESLSLHPIAVAGWVGMFATALNLLPGGQLDGGHILFSVFPKLHRWISLAVVLALVPLAKYCWIGWLLWAVVLWLTSHHPSIPSRPEISATRKWVAVFAVAMLVLSFTPAPITGASGRDFAREKWPQIRDGSRDTLHDLRDGVRHLFHRR